MNLLTELTKSFSIYKYDNWSTSFHRGTFGLVLRLGNKYKYKYKRLDSFKFVDFYILFQVGDDGSVEFIKFIVKEENEAIRESIVRNLNSQFLYVLRGLKNE